MEDYEEDDDLPFLEPDDEDDELDDGVEELDEQFGRGLEDAPNNDEDDDGN